MKKTALFLLATLVFYIASAGSVFYVKTDGDDNNNGRSWETAFKDVQKAIDAAAAVATVSNPCEVWIAKGTYKHGSPLAMKNNVSIYGGFEGTEASLKKREKGNETILDGENLYTVIDNKSVDENYSVSSSAILDNVVIQNGYGEFYGGGMANYEDDCPTLTNCTFRSNNAEFIGGGMYSLGNPTLTNCIFINNSAYFYGEDDGGLTGAGGGIYGSSTLINCTFYGNKAQYGGGAGAISLTQMINCTFSNNEACFGGAVFSWGVALINCTFVENKATLCNYEYSWAEGGAVACGVAVSIIENCIFWGNSAAAYGNEISIPGAEFASNVSIDNCIIQGGIKNIYNSSCAKLKNIITKDPKLGKMDYYGGSVPTIPVLSGSSAIGAGKVVDGVATDARGIVRSLTAPTIGAYEYKNDDDNIVNRIYVTTTGSDLNDGKSWATAFKDVQKAIDAAAAVATASNPSEVWIAKGAYKHDSPLTMKNNVAIYGGFAGIETTLEERTNDNETILYREEVIDVETDYVIYNYYTSVNPLTSSAKLDSVTITNAGCGIRNKYASPMITNCKICGIRDFGIYNTFSSPTITNCIILENSDTDIYNAFSFPTITNCIIIGNETEILNDDSSPNIINCTISSTICNQNDSSPKIINCIIWGNGFTSIYNDSSNPTAIVKNCIVKGGYSDGENIITEDPLLGELGYYGGNIKTIPVLAGSPAIGAGIVDESTPVTDARGFTRSATAPTIGAYEYISSPIIIETSLPTSLILFENTKHNLEVSASEKDGKKLTYTWYVDKYNGKGFVKAGSKPTLAITPKANMVGWQYYCAVSNGSETRNTSVSTITAVRTPVKITSKPKALNTFEGAENAGFSVSTTGYDVKYQWQVYKIVGYNAKGKPIYDWVDIVGATSPSYVPESDPNLDGAVYRCKVYNDGSAAYTSGVKYTVREAPKVEGIEVLQCKEKLNFDGSTVVAYEDYPIDLQATAKGYKIKYQWYKNGAAIKGATKSKYTIKKPLESQDSYYCEVYNGDVKDQSSTFVLEVRECPMPALFEGRTLSVYGTTDLGESLNFNFIFLKKTTLKLACKEYEVSNPAWSYKRVSPTKAAVTLKFKLYTNDEPVSKLNTISYSYSGEIEFKDNVFSLNLSDKKNGSFSGSFTDADIESADKTSLLSLPINKKITIGDETLMLLDKKNFAMGEVSGTYTYKSNKNGTGVLTLNYKYGSDKYIAEVSMLALSGNSGVAVVSTNWNEGKDKFISSSFEEFEIEK